jgi:GMP synthase-like glutamine amidotransferase
MKFLIFQHARVEHPAIFREFFAADGIEWHAIELDEGEPIPSLDGFDALMAFGGPMDVWQEREHPWLVAEKAAIRSWVRERRQPFLGICLGHQLLADALGGTVKKMDVPEIGVCEVTLSPAGTSSPLFLGLPPVLPVLQWHGAGNECRMAGWYSRATLTVRFSLSHSRTSLTGCSIIWSQPNAPSRNGARFQNIVNRSSKSPERMVRGAWKSKPLSESTTFVSIQGPYIGIS